MRLKGSFHLYRSDSATNGTNWAMRTALYVTNTTELAQHLVREMSQGDGMAVTISAVA